MASTFTTGFGIEKIGSGEQSGAWGTTTNHNLDIMDRIASYKAVALSGSTHTLTVREASPGSGTENLQDGMYRVIKFTGALGANNTVTIAPNTAPAYFIFENATTDSGSSGPYSVILTQGSGANITIQNGKNAIVYCDGAGSGAAVVNALSDLQIATLEVTGVAALDGAVTIGGASQFNSTVTVGVNDTGYDVKFFGDTASAYMLWDTSADDLILGGAARLGVGTAPAADMVLDVNGQIKSGSTGASLDTTPGGFGTFIQTASSGQCAVMAYSSGGAATLTLHSNTGGAAVVENIRMTPSAVTVNEDSADMDFRVESNGNANMLFVDGGTNRVGIGTAVPATHLEIAAPAATATVFRLASNKTGSGAGDRCRWDNYSANNSGVAYQLGFIDFDRADATATASYMAIQTRVAGTVAERMRISDAGNVGIGRTVPKYLLDVGPDGATSLAGAGITLFAGSSLTSSIGGVLNFRPALGLTASDIFNLSICAYDHGGDGNADGLSINGSDGVSFCTGANSRQERMRIDASGNVLAGGTTVRGSARLSLDCTGNGLEVYVVGNTNAVDFAVFRANSGGLCGNIARVAQTGAVAYNTTSDYRLKNTIAPMTGALAKVAKLKPVTYKWKEGGVDGQGFIAHELQEVVPDAVSGEKDAVDAEGKPKYQGVDTSFVVATLTAAIQEQQVIIESLKTRITALEG